MGETLFPFLNTFHSLCSLHHLFLATPTCVSTPSSSVYCHLLNPPPPPLTDGCFAGPPEAMLPPPRVRAPRGVALQIDAQTESNHDTALTLAAQGGHDELVQVLLAHGSDREHRDKKGVWVWVYVCMHIRTYMCTHVYDSV